MRDHVLCSLQMKIADKIFEICINKYEPFIYKMECSFFPVYVMALMIKNGEDYTFAKSEKYLESYVLLHCRCERVRLRSQTPALIRIIETQLKFNYTDD